MGVSLLIAMLTHQALVSPLSRHGPYHVLGVPPWDTLGLGFWTLSQLPQTFLLLASLKGQEDHRAGTFPFSPFRHLEQLGHSSRILGTSYIRPACSSLTASPSIFGLSCILSRIQGQLLLINLFSN